MSKKTILSIFVLIFFAVIALSSGSSSQYVTKSYSNSNSTSTAKSLIDPNAKFPKTAQTCPSCLGAGCAKCNYYGSVLR